MRYGIAAKSRVAKLALTLTLGALGLAVGDVPTAAAGSGPGPGFGHALYHGYGSGRDVDLEGAWRWRELILVVLPADVAMAYFGVAQPEGPIMILHCVAWGDMTMTQSGNEFMGIATQSSSCRTLGGQMAAHPPFPPAYGVTGTIQGHAVKFSADVGDGIDCRYRGVAMGGGFGPAWLVSASGGCDVPAPFEPNISKSYSYVLYRP